MARSDSKARRALAAGAVLLATGAAALVPAGGAAAAASECELETLPIPHELRFTFATGMSDDGSVIAYRAYPLDHGFERYPLLYSDGEVTEVPIPGTDQSLGDVNSEGVAAATTWTDDGSVPYVWRDGEATELPNSGEGEARGVNERGDIVGSVGRRPVLWAAGSDEAVELALPEKATRGTAVDIGDDGVIVGYFSTAEGDFKPYLWDRHGDGADLPIPDEVDSGRAHAYVADLNGDWASGYLSAPGFEGVGIRWNLAEGTAEVLDIEGPAAVAADGTAAGAVFPNAAVQTEEGVVELPGVSDPADNYFGDRAAEISADGSVIVGNVYAGEDASGFHVLNAVTWTCR
ncbi:hypothetical protein [Glycomyces arizonensis]|uniref:hypothetical protein n=1 Tax=Glycomyces arizonensis TaxID=256035 RepID=UPI0012EC3B02|nr:hypothetical protein [Glycomyces arizonensis]